MKGILNDIFIFCENFKFISFPLLLRGFQLNFVKLNNENI